MFGFDTVQARTGLKTLNNAVKFTVQLADGMLQRRFVGEGDTVFIGFCSNLCAFYCTSLAKV